MRSAELKAFTRTEGWQFILAKLQDWEEAVVDELADSEDTAMIYRNQGILRAIRTFRDMPEEEAAAAD